METRQVSILYQTYIIRSSYRKQLYNVQSLHIPYKTILKLTPKIVKHTGNTDTGDSMCLNTRV